MGSGGSGGGGGGGGGGGQHPGRGREEAGKEVEPVEIPNKDDMQSPANFKEDKSIDTAANDVQKNTTYDPSVADVANPNLEFDDPKIAAAFEKLQENPGLQKLGGVPMDDIWVLERWTGIAGGLGVMNPKDASIANVGSDNLSMMLWGGKKMTPEGKLFNKRLGEAVDNLPKYKGQSYRTVGFEKGSGRADAFEVGKTFTTKAYMGTSSKHTRISTPPSVKQIKSGEFSGKEYMHITVQSKSGGQIDRIFQAGESEILHKPGTKFLTTHKAWNEARQVWDIRVKEI